MFVAVDGGATKTIAIGVNEKDFGVITVGLAGPSNLRSVTRDVAKKNIQLALNTVLATCKGEGISRMIFGLAGFGDSKHNTQVIQEMVKDISGDIPYYVTNDGEPAMFLITLGGDGLAVAPGTGSVGNYRSGNLTGRVGGWSYLTSDQGSGFWISRKALEMAEKSYDGIIEKTLLVETYENYFNMDLRDIVSDLENNFDKRKIASLAPMVDDLALRSDAVARHVMELAIDEIKAMIDGMEKYFTGSHTVGCAGGVIRSKIVRDALIESYPDIGLYYGYHIVAGGILKLITQLGLEVNMADIRKSLISGIDYHIEHYDPEKRQLYLLI